MPTYVSLFRYTSEAWSQMVRNPSSRAEAAAAVIEQAGGEMLQFFWMLGDLDGLVIYSMPSERAAAAYSATVSTSGRIAEQRTHQLLDAEDATAALSLAGSLREHYQPPGASGDWRRDYDTLGA